ncbi:CobW family GTP-binding protein [Paraburkholderia sp. SIMBA_027]|uniref:CobW family GTP-binding protein n=1 Tax=Paraburkholderia sp. SIMBA_027 TaxID=3085770 RepID=UPI00397D31C7
MSLAYDVLPVTLVTGFLGSGKSTLIADALTGERARDTAVLVNEFGAVGLDHLLMGEVGPQTVLLDNGCLCCAMRGEMKEALAMLFSRRARGETPPFSRVIVETTGLATPAPIIATLLGDAVLASHYTLAATLTVVDAVNARTQRAAHPEWLAQVSAADRFLVTKADLADAAGVEALIGELQALNPAAQVRLRDAQAPHAQLEDVLGAPVADPLQAAMHAASRVGGATRALRLAGVVRAESAESPEATPEATPTAHEAELARIEAFCARFDEPLDWAVFTLWLTMLLNRHGERILRVKGVLALEGSDLPVVLHTVHHLVHPVLHLDAWPDAERSTRLVFITDGLSQDAIMASYRRFHAHLHHADVPT